MEDDDEGRDITDADRPRAVCPISLPWLTRTLLIEGYDGKSSVGRGSIFELLSGPDGFGGLDIESRTL